MIRIFNQDVSPKSLLLMLLEALLIALSLLCAVRLRFWSSPLEFEAYTSLPDFAIQALVVTLIFQSCFYFNDLYDLNVVRRRYDQILCLGQSLGAGCIVLALIYFLAPGLLIGRGVFFISVFLLVLFVMISRITLDKAWTATRPEGVLILGTGHKAITIAREVSTRADLNVKLVGMIRERGAFAGQDMLHGYSIVGGTDELEEIAAAEKIDRIIVALEDQRGVLPTASLVKLKVQGVTVEDVHSAMAALTGRLWLETVRPSWFVFSNGFHRSKLGETVKRSIDLAASVVGLVVSLPLMALVALAVKLDSPGPVLYRQVRIGWKGHPFEVLKFRSMCADAEANTGARWALKSDPRVTRVGKYLRKFRLDELPQFVNVIRGEMSFVGPRPERPVFVKELRKAISYYDERHSVRPGLTGWAQVQYSYGSTVEDAFRKLEYDLFYLKNMSVLFDLAIIFKTIRIVLTGRGAR